MDFLKVWKWLTSFLAPEPPDSLWAWDTAVYGTKRLFRGAILAMLFFSLAAFLDWLFPWDDEHDFSGLMMVPLMLVCLVDFWEGCRCLLLAMGGKTHRAKLESSGEAILFVAVPFAFFCSGFLWVHLSVYIPAKIKATLERKKEMAEIMDHLRKGRDHWNNEFMTTRRGYWINFDDADLSGMDLSGLNLQGMWFQKANLRRTKFDGCDLSFANFSGADCREASFRWARLYSGKFYGTDLRKADFSGSYLQADRLDDGNREGAILEGIKPTFLGYPENFVASLPTDVASSRSK